MTKINKITYGFVIQTWDCKKKKWTKQEFIAGDQVEFDDENGDCCDDETEGYLPFEMIQPV
jgi:hypothetical protein